MPTEDLWNDNENIGTQSHIEVTGVERSGDTVTVGVAVSGNGCDGGGSFTFASPAGSSHEWSSPVDGGFVMRIGIIGSGHIGATVARLLAASGHEVVIANSRGPGSLAELAAELGDRGRAATVAEAAAFGDIVLVAVPLHAIGDLPPAPFAGRIVMDANNYYPDRDGHIPELDNGSTTSTELLAAHLPDAQVVKAFNTMYYVTLAAEGAPNAPREERLVLFVAGDDAGAKRRVSDLIEEIGFAAIDTGSLAEGGRLQQAGGPLYNRTMRIPEAEAELG